MRLLLTPAYIASVCLSLVNGAEFLDGSDDEQGFGMERSQTECFGDEEAEGGMGERTDSSHYYVESDVASNGSSIVDGLKLAKEIESNARLSTIRSGKFKGEGSFSCRYVGGGAPKKRDPKSLSQEARQNSLASLELKDVKPFLGILALSKPGTYKVSPDAVTSAIPRPSYMRQATSKTSLQQDLLDAL